MKDRLQRFASERHLGRRVRLTIAAGGTALASVLGAHEVINFLQLRSQPVQIVGCYELYTPPNQVPGPDVSYSASVSGRQVNEYNLGNRAWKDTDGKWYAQGRVRVCGTGHEAKWLAAGGD